MYSLLISCQMFTILFGTFISINIFLVEEFSSFEFNVIFMMLKAFEKFHLYLQEKYKSIANIISLYVYQNSFVKLAGLGSFSGNNYFSSFLFASECFMVILRKYMFSQFSEFRIQYLQIRYDILNMLSDLLCLFFPLDYHLREIKICCN